MKQGCWLITCFYSEWREEPVAVTPVQIIRGFNMLLVLPGLL